MSSFTASSTTTNIDKTEVLEMLEKYTYIEVENLLQVLIRIKRDTAEISMISDALADILSSQAISLGNLKGTTLKELRVVVFTAFNKRQEEDNQEEQDLSEQMQASSISTSEAHPPPEVNNRRKIQFSLAIRLYAFH